MALTQISTDGIKNGTITGSDLATNVDLVDNQKIRFGTDDDLQIYHANNNSYIDQTGVGHLFIRGNGTNGVLIRPKSGENSVVCLSDGAVELYHDNSKKFETMSSGVKAYGDFLPNTGDTHDLGANAAKWSELHLKHYLYMPDAGRIRLGSSYDMQLFYDGSTQVLLGKTGDTVITCPSGQSVRLNKSSADNFSAESMLRAFADGAVELYHNNSKKFETHSGGVNLLGSGTDAIQMTGDVWFNNNEHAGADIYFNSGDKRLIFEDNVKAVFGGGGDLEIIHNGSHSKISDTGTGSLILSGSTVEINNAADSENMIKAIQDAGVELFFNGVPKLETRAGDTIFHDDIRIQDNNKINIGTGDDLQIYHGGTDSHIENNTGQLKIASDTLRITNGAVSETQALFTADGAVELYHNNVKHFETTSIGCKLFDNDTSAALQFANSDGDNGYVMGESNNIIGFKDNNPHWLVRCIKDGAVELYYDNSKKLETYNDGITVNGRAQIDGHCFPYSNNASDLGLSSNRWRNVYTNDLHLSNEGGSNDVDGTWGSYTIQEGAEDLFLVNKRNGKKYKFNLTEVA